MRRFALLVIWFAVGIVPSLAQDKALADSLFREEQYDKALDVYRKLLDRSPYEKSELLYPIGISYLRTNNDRSLAIPYLERVVKDKGSHYPEVLYDLGQAYQYDHQYGKAIQFFNRFQLFYSYQQEEEEGRDSSEVVRKIDQCKNALELMKFPTDVSFKNLGEPVNTGDDELLPFVPADESFLLFTRKDREEGGKDIYRSLLDNGRFLPARPITSHINTSKGEESVTGVTPDGNNVLIHFKESEPRDGMYKSHIIEKNKIDKPSWLNGPVQGNGPVRAAILGKEEDILFFAAHREGGEGGLDLYISRELPNGEWGEPRNLGPSINTPEDESFPSLSPDGRTLYFSSRGHAGMGGYDLFKAIWNDDKQKWTQVQNLGYPLNTPYDDRSISISESGKYGYISSLRPEKGRGGYDIYRVEFGDVTPPYSLIKGYVRSAEHDRSVTDVDMTVVDQETGQVYGKYTPNTHTHRYVMILPPGEYSLQVEALGYQPYEENLTVLGKNAHRSEIRKDIELAPTH